MEQFYFPSLVQYIGVLNLLEWGAISFLPIYKSFNSDKIQGFRRYLIGFLAPALAWPTILLPTNMALIIQFLGFTGMYFADSSATRNGWGNVLISLFMGMTNAVKLLHGITDTDSF